MDFVILSASAGPDAGSLADWVAAISTAGAFGVSLWLLGREIADRKKASEKRAAEASDAKRSYVRRVRMSRPAVAFDAVPVQEDEWGPITSHESATVKVVLRNESDDRIFGVQLQVIAPPDEDGSVWTARSAPTLPVDGELGAGEAFTSVVVFDRSRDLDIAFEQHLQPVTMLSFRDSAGFDWTRSNDGTLSEVPVDTVRTGST